jgi:hypothetical protein
LHHFSHSRLFSGRLVQNFSAPHTPKKLRARGRGRVRDGALHKPTPSGGESNFEVPPQQDGKTRISQIRTKIGRVGNLPWWGGVANAAWDRAKSFKTEPRSQDMEIATLAASD